jgi:hypothetical protein
VADTTFKIKDTLSVNTNFIANGSQVSLGANSVITNNQISVGNSTCNVQINPINFFVGNTSSNVQIANTGISSPSYTGAGVMSVANSYWANTAGIVVTTDKLNAVGVYQTLTDAATIVWDHSLGMNFTVVLGGSRTLAFPTNGVAGRSGTILVQQNGTGGFTLSYAAGFKFDSDVAPVIGATASKYTLLFWHYINASYCVITMAAKNFT